MMWKCYKLVMSVCIHDEWNVNCGQVTVECMVFYKQSSCDLGTPCYTWQHHSSHVCLSHCGNTGHAHRGVSLLLLIQPTSHHIQLITVLTYIFTIKQLFNAEIISGFH